MNDTAKTRKRGPCLLDVEICASEVINVRDFCGDERAAIADYCADNNLINSNVFGDCVIGTVNKEWRESQKAAGVKPKYFTRGTSPKSYRL